MPTLRFLAQFVEGWNAHDVDRLMTFMDDDCAFETTAGPDACGKRTFRNGKIVLKTSYFKNRTV
jgi:ketosteroid isomerase-like protein